MSGPSKYDVSGQDYVILPDEKNFGARRKGVVPKEDFVAPTSLFEIGVGDDPVSGALFSQPAADSPRGLQLRAAAARRRGDATSAAELDAKAQRAEFAQRTAPKPDAPTLAKTKARIASRKGPTPNAGAGMALLLFGALGLVAVARRRR